MSRALRPPQALHPRRWSITLHAIMRQWRDMGLANRARHPPLRLRDQETLAAFDRELALDANDPMTWNNKTLAYARGDVSPSSMRRSGGPGSWGGRGSAAAGPLPLTPPPSGEGEPKADHHRRLLAPKGKSV